MIYMLIVYIFTSSWMLNQFILIHKLFYLLLYYLFCIQYPSIHLGLDPSHHFGQILIISIIWVDYSQSFNDEMWAFLIEWYHGAAVNHMEKIFDWKDIQLIHIHKHLKNFSLKIQKCSWNRNKLTHGYLLFCES